MAPILGNGGGRVGAKRRRCARPGPGRAGPRLIGSGNGGGKERCCHALAREGVLRPMCPFLTDFRGPAAASYWAFAILRCSSGGIRCLALA